MRDALNSYLANYSFGASPGGYSDPWARILVGRLVIRFPNFNARREAVKRHDLNHILTGYPPIDLRGEAEIAFFELGSGCGRFWAAWFFNALATPFALRWPIATWRAFLRGLRSKRSLYRGYNYEAVLDMPVERLRVELGI